MRQLRLRTYTRLIVWTLLACSWIVIASIIVLKVPPNGSDFGVYMAAAQALRIDPHATIYDWHVLAGVYNAHGGCLMWGLPYLYQPLLAILLEPLTSLPCRTAWTIWQVINLILWAYCTFQLSRWAAEVNQWLAVAVGALAISFLPLLQGLEIGQVHVIILAICVGAAAAARNNRPYLAGALLGFGMVIKYFPALLVLYFLLRGKWRIPITAAVVGGGLMIAQLYVVGIHTIVNSFIGVHLTAQSEVPRVLPGWTILAVCTGLAFVVGVLWAGREARGSEQLGIAWALCTMLAVSPVLQWPYLTWLLPAFAACLGIVADTHTAPAGWSWRRWGVLIAISLAFLLIVSRMVLVRTANSSANVTMVSIAATFVLWVVCGVLYVRSAGITFPRMRVPLRQPWTADTRSEGIEVTQ